ncbi:MAG: hypothetical protein ACPG31_06320 [Planctomycetota bacterium]
MRTLRLYLYFTALAGLLLGVVDAITLALGGASADGLLAQGFVLLALASGLRYQSAGHVPLRASFLLLGLAGILPMMAGYAPLGAAFSAFLFLPMRATGARIAAAAQTTAAGSSMLLLGGVSAWLFLTALAPGLPGFLVLWCLAGILQRIAVPEGDAKVESPAVAWISILPTLLIGAGLGMTVLHLSTYASLFDGSSAPQDLSRGFTLACAFFAVWFTLGSGFAESRLRVPIAAITSLACGALLSSFTRLAAFLSSPDGFYYWVKHPKMKRWFFENEPALPEVHAAYVPLLTLAMFALPAALLALLVRNLLRRDGLGVGPQSLAPLLGGFGISLLGTGLMPATLRIEALPLVGMVFFVLGAVLLLRQMIPNPIASLGAFALGIVVIVMARPQGEAPILRHSLTDSFIWQHVLSTPDLDLEAETPLQQEDLFSVSRLLQRNSENLADSRQRSLLFDNRNRLSAATDSLDARRAEALLAFGLAEQPQSICWVGVPQPEVVQTLLDHGAKQMSFATDPATVGQMALFETTLAKEAPLQEGQSLDFQRSLAHCDGPFGLVLFDSAAMWDGRHNILRSEFLRQASLRLEADGTCALFLAPEQLVPGMLPQWYAEFQDVFPQTTLAILPDGMAHARIAFLGRKGDAETPWPVPAASLQPSLERLGLPIADADDFASLQVHLKPNTGGSHWMFRGPFRPADAALAATTYQLIDRHQSVDRSTAVLADLLQHEQEGHPSLLGFYAEQFGAQVFSVHDTYFDDNPYATETSEAALQALIRVSARFPDAQPLKRTWGEVGVSLVESREVAWLDEYFERLFHELGWQEPEIRLGLAHAAMEMLDFERAQEHLDAILALHPNFLPAKELKRLADAEEQVPRDEHAGHNH